MKSAGRSVVLTVVLVLGLAACGGGGGGNSGGTSPRNEPTGSGGTMSTPGGTPPGMTPTGGGPTAALQARFATCPTDLIINEDIPCFVGTYEGATTDTGAACAFVYDEDGEIIYRVGAQTARTVVGTFAGAVFEKKPADNAAGFAIIWSVGLGSEINAFDLTFRSDTEPASANGLFIRPVNPSLPSCLITNGPEVMVDRADSTANLLGRTWQTPAVLNGNGDVGVLTDTAAFEAGMADDGSAFVTFRQPDASGRMAVTVVEGRPGANGASPVWSSPRVLDAEVPLLAERRPRLAVSTTGHAVVTWLSELPCEADAYESDPQGKSCRYLYASRRLAMDTDWERPVRVRASPPSNAQDYYARINAQGDVALVFTSFVPVASDFNDTITVALRRGDEASYRSVELQGFSGSPFIDDPIEQRVLLELDEARSVFAVGDANAFAELVRARATTSAASPSDFIRDPNNDPNDPAFQLQLSNGFAAYTWGDTPLKPEKLSVYSPLAQQWLSGLNLSAYSLWGDTTLVGGNELLIYSGCRVTPYANDAFGETRRLPPYCGRDRRAGVYAFNRNGDYVGVNWAGQPGQWGYYSRSQNSYLKGAPGRGATVSDDFVLGTPSDVFGAMPTQLLLTSNGMALAVTTNTFSSLPSVANPTGTRGTAQKLWAVYLQ